MRKGTPGFQPKRLVQARDSRGLTQVALADMINYTTSSISRWEAAGQSPEPAALDTLARALKLPAAFFLKPQPDRGCAPVFFRTMSSTTHAMRRRAQARLLWAEDIAHVLQEWVDLPAMNLPRSGATDYREIGDADIEQLALACRKAWNLGTAPISDVLFVLENAGICVVREEIGSVGMDGLSYWSSRDDRGYIFIAADKASCVRSRLDAAHELAHLVLHSKVDYQKLDDATAFREVERQAFLFAGALLMPAESFAPEIWSPSLNGLLALKERWRVSIGAMVERCRSLKLINDEYEQKLWKYYRIRGWRYAEPLDDTLRPEKPKLLARFVQLLLYKGVLTRQYLLNTLCLPAYDIESLCGLPQGFMTATPAVLVELPRLKGKSTAQERRATADGITRSLQCSQRR